MSSISRSGSTLRGRLSSYRFVRDIYRSTDDGGVYLAKNPKDESCIVKSIHHHWRLRNEASILKRYQGTTPSIRPLIDEIIEPSEPASIVLRYLDTDLLKESNKKRLSRSDIKRVAKAILLALKILHEDGLVHTDVKLDNVFVNHGSTTSERFSEIQLGDFGGVVHQDSDFAKDGHLIGAGISRSPEAILQMHWGTATDIWSFGNTVLSLLYGGDYHLFNPAIEGLKPDDDEYFLTILKRMYKFFGPFPVTYSDNPDTMTIVNYFNDSGPPEKPFHLVTTKEIPAADNKFLIKVMKLDPRERPTVGDLLADEWFSEESEDTRIPLKSDAVDRSIG